MNHGDTMRRVPHPLVDLENLGPQPMGLTRDAFSGEAGVHRRGRGEIFFQGRADRRHEHRRPPRPCHLAGEHVSSTAADVAITVGRRLVNAGR